MYAVVINGPKSLKYVTDFPTPKTGKGEIRLKVRSCGFCGTDFKIFTYGHKHVHPPHIIGHEIVGEVDQIGPGVKSDLKIGDRVVVSTTVGCGKCRHCREGYTNMCSQVTKDGSSIGLYTNGGFAEYILIPREAVAQQVLVKIPDHVPNINAAICEPLSCVINGQDKLNLGPRDSMVIIGCGPIGCLHAQLAKIKGVKKIIMLDLLDSKIKLARQFIPEAIFINNTKSDPKPLVSQLTGGHGPDVVVVAAPTVSAQQLAIEIAAIKGRVSLFSGLPTGTTGGHIETNLIHYNEISVHGAFASSRKHFVKSLELLSQGKIDTKHLITKILPLKNISQAIDLYEKGTALKMVIAIS